MAVNLVKHKDEMLKAWQEVVDDKNPINWALYAYDGQSYDLKFFNKGGKIFVPLLGRLGIGFATCDDSF